MATICGPHVGVPSDLLYIQPMLIDRHEGWAQQSPDLELKIVERSSYAELDQQSVKDSSFLNIPDGETR